MDNILILDTSVGSRNKGDDIIMECVYKELEFLKKKNFVLTLPTHVSSFHFYQVYKLIQIANTNLPEVQISW